MPSQTRELGAQNPELKNSPIAWESDEDIETLRESQPSERGVWVPAGPSGAGRT